jgi:hypothetical protein
VFVRRNVNKREDEQRERKARRKFRKLRKWTKIDADRIKSKN